MLPPGCCPAPTTTAILFSSLRDTVVSLILIGRWRETALVE
jgi:hypothetical protein